MSAATSNSLCTFEVSGLTFGVDVLSVQEVLKPRPTTQVPLAAREIQGLINLRGQVVTTIDLRRRLQFDDRPEGAPSMLVIARTCDGQVGLIVDAVGDVLEVVDKDFENPPRTMPSAARDLVLGVYKLPHNLLHVLDIDRACELSS